MSGWRFKTELGRGPVTPDLDAARAYHQKIRALLERDDALPRDSPARWTKSERARLTHLDRVWAARAAGRDRRYLYVGLKPGRVTRELELVINPEKARESEAWRRALEGK
jgi:hypothetical protein